MKKNIKRYLAFILAFALMATYSFGPQNISVFAEGDEGTSTVAEQQDNGADKKAPAPKPVEKPVAPEAEQSAPSTDDSEQASSSDNASSDAEESTEAVTEEPVVDPEEATEETEEEDSYPAQSFSRTVNGMTVKISAPEGALPEDSSVKVKAIKASQIEDAVDNLIEGGQVVKAVDITFYNKEGKEIEPKKNVSVTFTSSAFKGLNDPQVVHIKDNGAAERVSGSSVSGSKASFKSDDFSVYVVVEDGDEARLKVKFVRADGSTEEILVKKADTESSLYNKVLYDPGSGPVANNEVFHGWAEGTSYDSDTTSHDIDSVREIVKTKLEGGVTDGETLTFTAMVFKVVNLTYKDQTGHSTLKIDQVLIPKGSSSGTATVEQDYTPNDGQTFVGWTPDIDQPGADPTYSDDPEVFENGDTITVGVDTTIYPYVRYGHWLSFDSNIERNNEVNGYNDSTSATYISPKFYENGATTAAPSPAPTRTGYTLQGWYTDKNMTQRFNWGGTLDRDMTIYAKWTPARANYTVVFWQQNPSDSVNAANPRKTYSFYKSEVRTANTGANVRINTANSGTTADNRRGGNSANSIGEMGYYFTYNATNTDTGTVRVAGDGSSVLNVYYDRRTITFNFYQNNYSRPTTFTGLYGAPFNQWPDAGRNYAWAATGSDGGVYFMTLGVTSFMIPEIFGSTATVWNLQRRAYSWSEYLYYYGQDTDGNYTQELSVSHCEDLDSTLTLDNTLFPGFTMAGYYNRGRWVDCSDQDTARVHLSNIDTEDGKRIFYYDRNKYDLNYNSNSAKVKTEKVFFEKNLSGYEDFVPTNGPQGYFFDGWYTDPGFTSEFNFDQAMPRHNVNVYAKWTKMRFRIYMDITGDGTVDIGDVNLPGEGQGVTWRADWGETFQSSAFQSMTADGYSLAGWKLADGRSFSFNSLVTEDLAADMTYKDSDQRSGTDPITGRSWSDESPAYHDVVGWIQITAKWRKDIDNSTGITVEYDAGDGYFESEDVNVKHDPSHYTDHATTYAYSAPNPTDPTKEFDCWIVQKWNGTEYVDTSTTVKPGQTFTLDINDARVEGEGETATYTIRVIASYKDKEAETPTHIYWIRNYGGLSYVRKDGVGDNPYPTLKINQGVSIPAAPQREGYEFLGWAKVASQGDTPAATADVTEPNLVWYDADSEQYYSDADCTKVATQVAADEFTPYDDIYAVWKAKHVLKVEAISGTWNYDGELHSGGPLKITLDGEDVTNNWQRLGIQIGYQKEVTGGAWSRIAEEWPNAWSVKDVGDYTKYKIRASYPGANLATDIGTLEITPRPVTINVKLPDKTVPYNGEDQGFYASPFSYSTDDTVLKAERNYGPTYTGARQAYFYHGTDVGEYKTNVGDSVINFRLSSTSDEEWLDNYDPTYVVTQGTLTITAKKVTVNVSLPDKEVTYNGQDQGFYATPWMFTTDDEGLKAEEGYGPHYTGTGQANYYHGKNVGEYYTTAPETASSYQLAEGTSPAAWEKNYDVTYKVTQGTLTIKPATMKITAKTDSKVYDNTALKGGATCSVEGATITYSYKKADGTWSEYSADVPSITDAGTRTYKAKAELANYVTIESEEATLTVTKAPLKIKVKDQTYTYNAQPQGEDANGGNPYTSADVETKLEFLDGTKLAEGDKLISFRLKEYKETDADKYADTLEVDNRGWTVGHGVNTTEAVKVALDKNYEVEFLPGTLTIKPATMKITAKTDSKVYDNTALKGGATCSVEGATITYSYKKADGTWTEYSSDVPSITKAGTLEYKAKAELKNYETIESEAATLTIDPRGIRLKVTGNSDSVVYNGEEQSVSGYTYEFTVDNSDGNAFSADNLSVIYRGGSHDTASGTNVGTYDMTMTKDMFDVAVSGGLDRTSIYMDFRDDFTLVNGKLTITPATVTVKADNKSKTQGQADPALTATVTGLFGDDTIEYSLSRETGQAPGTYTITPSGETEQGNYIVVFETGTFTINAAPAPGGGGGPAGGGPAGPVAAVVNPVPAPAAIADEPAPTTINDEPAPKTDNPVWALLNLLCMLATALMSLIMLIRFFVKRKGGARIASLIPAVGAIVAFILTEDMSAQMVMVDKWTIMMVIILAIQAGVAVLANMKKNEDEEEASEA